MKIRPSLLALIFTVALAPFAGAEDAKKTAVDFPLDAKPLERVNTGGRLVSYADVLDKVTPAVVSITTAQMVQQMPRGRGDMDEFMRRFWGVPSPQQGEEEQPQRNGKPNERKVPLGLGSGTIIHSDGYILTNRHVISKPDGTQADEITVTLQDKREFTAKVIGADPKTDIAVIKIEGKSLPVAKMTDSNVLRVGDVVFAVGNPMGVGMTVTSGIVSALGRSDLGILGRQGGIENFIQTDASINPGNSGGPLVDAEGRIVGVNTAIVSRTGSSIGLGFAVPTAIARDVVASLANNGKVSRGYFGLSAQDIDRPTAEALNLVNQRGALVNNVAEESPAAKAGLRDGDIITGIDSRPVDSWTALRTAIAQLKPGMESKVEVLREGKKELIAVKVGDRETADVAAAENSPLPGVAFGTLTDDMRKRFGIPENVKGLLVTAVEGDSPLTGRLAPGVVIINLNRQPVKDAKDFAKKLVKGRANAMQLYYNGGYSYLVVRP
jgi:Do/DeqQ family serine protease